MKPLKNRLLILWTFLLILVVVGRAERLPVRGFTTADGLGSSAITHVMRDSRGFLWFATRDGLSRFDGERFRNYHLPDDANPNIIQVIQRQNGDYYVWPRGGELYRFNSATTVSYDSSGATLILNAEKVADSAHGLLYEDRDGRLWATGPRLTLFDETSGQPIANEVPIDVPGLGPVRATRIVQSRDSSYWIATDRGLLRLSSSLNCLEFYKLDIGPQLADYLAAIFEDAEGRIWLGAPGNLFVIEPRPLDAVGSFSLQELRASDRIRVYTTRDGLTSDVVRSFEQTSDGAIYISTEGGLTVYDGSSFRNLNGANGIGKPLNDSTMDASGDVWLVGGTGAYKLSPGGLTTFRNEDGLADGAIDALYEDSNGDLIVSNGSWNVSRFHGHSFTTAKPQLGADVSRPIWSSNVSLIDRAGGWWFLSEKKLFYFENVGSIEQLSNLRPTLVFDTGPAFLDGAFYRLYEDKTGMIWLSMRSTDPAKNGLLRWNQASRKFQNIGAEAGLPSGFSPSAFSEDAHGSLWICSYGGGGVARWRNGRFEDLSAAADLPGSAILGLFGDREGRIWIASSEGGLTMVGDPTAEQPVFKHYTVADGLGSNNVRTIVEDNDGNIYAGTVRGVDKLTPATGKVAHLTIADGLANEFVTTALKTRDGAIWFGTRDGLSRLVPKPERPSPPPPIFISGLRVAGVENPVSELGQTEVAKLDLDHNQSNLQIEFMSIGSSIRYQFQLEGGDGGWSQPAAERTVNFSSLSPGNYKFLVRAVSADGTPSESPAVVSFSIAPPLWRTWTFYAVALIGFVGFIFMFDRRRTMRRRERRAAEDAIAKANSERLRELEQVRRRIATDLHDDIGSSLTHISILSEVLKRRVDARDASVADPLGVIAESSRELVDSMSDIVWAINPVKDTLQDLSGRMRRFAADIFTVRDIEFTFNAPEGHLELGANIRREIFLIFKEALHNVVKHSGATSVEIELRADGGNLILDVRDDGSGFDVKDTANAGHGLASIRERAMGTGGSVTIVSKPRRGTQMTVSIPLHSPNGHYMNS